MRAKPWRVWRDFPDLLADHLSEWQLPVQKKQGMATTLTQLSETPQSADTFRGGGSCTVPEREAATSEAGGRLPFYSSNIRYPMPSSVWMYLGSEGFSLSLRRMLAMLTRRIWLLLAPP